MPVESVASPLRRTTGPAGPVRVLQLVEVVADVEAEPVLRAAKAQLAALTLRARAVAREAEQLEEAVAAGDGLDGEPAEDSLAARRAELDAEVAARREALAAELVQTRADAAQVVHIARGHAAALALVANRSRPAAPAVVTTPDARVSDAPHASVAGDAVLAGGDADRRPGDAAALPTAVVMSTADGLSPMESAPAVEAAAAAGSDAEPSAAQPVAGAVPPPHLTLVGRTDLEPAESPDATMNGPEPLATGAGPSEGPVEAGDDPIAATHPSSSPFETSQQPVDDASSSPSHGSSGFLPAPAGVVPSVPSIAVLVPQPDGTLATAYLPLGAAFGMPGPVAVNGDGTAAGIPPSGGPVYAAASHTGQHPVVQVPPTAPREPFLRRLLHLDVILPIVAALIVLVVLFAWVG